MNAVVGREAAVTYICWKNITVGHFCGFHCQMTKQFINEFVVLYSRENNPSFGGIQSLAAVEHSF